MKKKTFNTQGSTLDLKLRQLNVKCWTLNVERLLR